MKAYHETENGILYCGDYLDIVPNLSTQADLVLTDPPYGTTAIKWDIPLNLTQFWEYISILCRKNTPILVFSAQPFTTDLINSNRSQFRFEYIWNKVKGANFFNLKQYPFKVHENIILFCEGAYTYNPQRVYRTKSSLIRDPIGTTRIRQKTSTTIQHYGITYGGSQQEITADGKKHPISILTFSSGEKGIYKYKHPTKKPIGVLSELVNTYSNEGDLVIDPFAGSGSTAIACIRNKRKYVIIEKEEMYCEIAAKRIVDEMEQLSIGI